MAQSIVTVGSTGGDRMTFKVVGRTHPGAKDAWQGNWVNAEIDVHAGAFRGRASACLRTDEFESVLEQLKGIAGSSRTTAEYKAAEDWLGMTVQGDGAGQFIARGWLVDDLAGGNRLEFVLKFGSAELQQTIRQIEDLLAAFPVIGKG